MFITILTPTYNRASTLIRLYESLEKQIEKNFEWLIIDDGSIDETKKLVSSIKKNTKMKIKYVYKENGGKHTAINEGIKIINTPLTFIVDSDDFLTEDAVSSILKKWNFCKDKPNIGSIWFLQSDLTGKIVGDKFPDNEIISNYIDIMINSKVKGDKKAVYLTKIRKKFPFPYFKNEKFIGEGIIHKRIGEKYDALFVNKVIYKCEYLQGGLSQSGRRMRIKNPRGGMANSKEFLSKDVNFKIRLKKIILYITYGLFANEKKLNIIKNSGYPLFCFIMFPIAFILYLYWK